MGGAEPPLYEPLPRLYSPPPKRGLAEGQVRHRPLGANPRGQPFGVVSGAVPPQDGPPILGIAGIWLGSIFLVAIVAEFYRCFGLSCSDYSSQ